MSRILWRAQDFIIKDEPLVKSLLEYRQSKNRLPMSLTPENNGPGSKYGFPNLISSMTTDGKQMPIIDMDFPHRIVESTTPGHTHIFIDVPMSKWRWFWLMCALRYAGVIELGFFVWSIRRGGNFVRIPGTTKTDDPKENTKPTYGWFFKMRNRS